MRVLFATSEVFPLAKTGGLADVSRGLPEALAQAGHEVYVVTPFHRAQVNERESSADTGAAFTLPCGSLNLTVRVYEASISAAVKYLLLRCDELFDRTNLYGNELGDYQDNAARFAFFSRAALELARRLPGGVPGVVHANDWHTALLPAYFRAAGLPARQVLTIHNLAYQGSFAAEDFALTGLPADYFSPRGVEFYGRLNFLKGGILLADAVTTVSPTYAREIQTPEQGCGLDAVLRENAHKLTGILNGIDDTTWHPGCDPHIPRRYSVRSLPGKKVCRRALLAKHDWPEDTEEMVIGMISRLAPQKGFDLLKSGWARLRKMPVRLIVLGRGDPAIEDWLQHTAASDPDKLRVHLVHSEDMAHLIEAGCDAFLMPSRYEPCGLNQMYSQRYGTPPIVHATGGLKDTVIDATSDPEHGTGFVFHEHSATAMLGAVKSALAVFADPAAWKKIMVNAMSRDFSWNSAAAAYEKVYAAT